MGIRGDTVVHMHLYTIGPHYIHVANISFPNPKEEKKKKNTKNRKLNMLNIYIFK